MSIKVKCYQPAMLLDVVNVYNQLTAKTPYCYPITPEVFTEAVTSKDIFDPAGFFVAFDGGKPAGFLHVRILEKAGRTEGGIQMFLAEDRSACRKLLSEAIDFLKRGGAAVCHVMAFESKNQKFYAGVHMGYEVPLWEGYYPVAAALRKRGFELVREGFVMSMPLNAGDEILEPGIDVSFSVNHTDDAGSFYTNGVVETGISGEKIGSCDFHFLKRLSRHLGKNIGQIAIRVNEQYHRKGIGSGLLSRAHQQLFDKGARKVILTTNYSLYPAIRLYEKLGYRKELIKTFAFKGYLNEMQP